MHFLKKKTFLLLEVLICLAIVSLTIFPLLAPSLMIAQNERAFSDELKRARAASALFGEITVKLYRHEIPFEDVIGEAEYPNFKFEEPTAIKKDDEGRPRFVLVPITITIAKSAYRYSVFLEKRQVETP